MSRLIKESDVSKLILNYFELLVLRGQYKVDTFQCNADLQRLLEELPTAFDTEKVVAEMEKKAEKCREKGFQHENKGFSHWADIQYAKHMAYLNAINEVRKGGIDG